VEAPSLGKSAQALLEQSGLKLSFAADALHVRRALATPERWSLVLCDTAHFFDLGLDASLADLGDRLSASVVLLRRSGSSLSPAEAAARGAADVVTAGDLEHLKAVVARELASGAARRRLAVFTEGTSQARIPKFIGLGTTMQALQAGSRTENEPLSARAAATRRPVVAITDDLLVHAGPLTLADLPPERAGADDGTSQELSLDYVRERIESAGVALEYQPIVPLKQDRPSPPMFEVLLRLRDERGLLVPARRIFPALARGGLLARIDARVFHMVLQILARVQRKDHTQARFYVNLSEETLSEPEALRSIISTIAEAAVEHGSLVVEVAKPCLADPDRLSPLCAGLLEHGHSLLMKGFKPEDSESLAARLDWVRQVKINPNILERMDRGGEEARNVRAAVRWLQDQGVTVIGMAVDHPRLLSRLRELGVDYIQGYFVGMPQTGLSVPTLEDIPLDPWPLGAP
jgi:EAL domain-containing protein (putative c-di-GMP-specific phosphodiesterase class I)